MSESPKAIALKIDARQVAAERLVKAAFLRGDLDAQIAASMLDADLPPGTYRVRIGEQPVEAAE
jgi:hypothetical protein